LTKSEEDEVKRGARSEELRELEDLKRVIREGRVEYLANTLLDRLSDLLFTTTNHSITTEFIEALKVCTSNH
jgi:hypothetical protein